ncbi:MAG: hypothetical protein ACR2QC_09355 [Gammaproteobacteria bacterium]
MVATTELKKEFETKIRLAISESTRQTILAMVAVQGLGVAVIVLFLK